MPKTFESRTDELIKLAYSEAGGLLCLYIVDPDININDGRGLNLSEDEKDYVQRFVRTFIAAQLMKRAEGM